MDLREQLLRDEGLILHTYRDSQGYLTIGVGHNLDARGITKEAALQILDDDISDTKVGLMAKWPWMRELSPARLGAFINLAFNVGVRGVQGFKRLLLAAQAGQWEEAAAELLASPYATQVGERAMRLATQLKTDTWQ